MWPIGAGRAPELGLGHLLSGTGVLDQLRIAAVSVVGADTVNNLPAVLVVVKLATNAILD